MRAFFQAIIFFIIGLIVGLYLPQVPQYQKYAPQVNEFFAAHKSTASKPAEKEETPNAHANEKSK